jgi:hypothetical protein
VNYSGFTNPVSSSNILDPIPRKATVLFNKSIGWNIDDFLAKLLSIILSALRMSLVFFALE